MLWPGKKKQITFRLDPDIVDSYKRAGRGYQNGTVFDLAVTERFRRNGIGEKLYQAAQTWFADHGVHRIEIRVVVSNEISTAFWRKMGFKPFVETVFKEI